MRPRLRVIEPPLVGRAGESSVVGALLDRATRTEACALLIFGDAGVGKTALVKHACIGAATQAVVLAGACLPLTSMTVPFLAIRSALKEARRDGVAVHEVIGPSDSSPSVPEAFDTWLDEVCRDQLVVLFIDDLHWADQGTLDVLMYLLAGPADRHLAVIATIRSGELGDTHPLHRWLADIRRLPRVEQMTLGPLDRVATSEQIAAFLGAPPHQSLVEDVFTHTRGNPYLNSLAVNGLPPDARTLPADFPADLKSAVLQSWRRLSPPTRELARILAVSGVPLHAQDLADVVTSKGFDGGDVVPLLSEAVEAGTLDMARGGTYWFHHPLSAEVLEDGLTDDERRRWHTAFATLAERRLAEAPVPAVELMVAAADHHHRAGHLIDAYNWALRASAAAEAAGGITEMLRLLRRAVDLRQLLPEAQESLQELLQRLISAAAAAGVQEEELRAIDMLLEGDGPDPDPLLVAELLVRRGQLRFSTGRSFYAPDDLRKAARLSAAEPESWQHALALAELAHAEMWHDDPGAAANADHALTIARAAGDPRALSYALTANAMVHILGERGNEGSLLAAEAVDAAVEARDFWAFCHATMWEGNGMEIWSSRFYANHLRRHREQAIELGAPHTYVALLSADEAMSWLAIGEWRECLNRLRVALGSDPGPFADASARLTAARLAAWQGRRAEAQAHLARADELVAGRSAFRNYAFDATRAEVCLASGDPQAAYAAAMAGAMSTGVVPTMCEWLIPLASRALADMIRDVRDARNDPSALMARLDELTTRFPSVIRDIGESSVQWELQIDALNHLYAAEVGRARQVLDNDAQWVRAADACHDGMLAWEEAYSCWRAAESLLIRDGHQRALAASLLRRGLDLADELHAWPIQSELRELAASARISLDPVTTGSTQLSAPPEHIRVLPGLTAREREILDHVVAGRTYGEIARALVISEKTVSSHISNLLRKTGTSSRVDLSRLATRVARNGS